jgi:hypothetical protein
MEARAASAVYRCYHATAHVRAVGSAADVDVFQAIFLMALGRLCYQMGMQAKWDPHHIVLQKIKKLTPSPTSSTPGRTANGINAG